tara:strand:- start:211 stop:669 length:459 start_codon:yes stop_codon:yes gene_type:complete
MKILNLNEGSFPVKLRMELDKLSVPEIGKLATNLTIEAKISKISKNILKCDGKLDGVFIDICQNCLKETEVNLSNQIEVAIKDIKELLNDTSDQDQTHYQDLEYFNIESFIEEEVALIYPNIVKCSEDCITEVDDHEAKKNLPFKKIRDLID